MENRKINAETNSHGNKLSTRTNAFHQLFSENWQPATVTKSQQNSLAGRQTIRPYLHRYAINKSDAHNSNWQSLKVHVHQHCGCARMRLNMRVSLLKKESSTGSTLLIA